MADALLRQARFPLPATSPGRDDASRMYSNRPAAVFRPPGDTEKATREIAELVRSGKKISISGARHSMGGHTFSEGGTVIDMLPVNSLRMDGDRPVLIAGAGAKWADVVPSLDKRGLSVGVMQSNKDFTIGGSISVNCHGWQHDSQPIASTVESFTLVTADGSVKSCSRSLNRELFSLALGGYGLFGVITEVRLRVVPNEVYRTRRTFVPAADYLKTFRQMTAGNTAGMAYGRICTAPDHYLTESIVTVLDRAGGDEQAETKPPFLIRAKAKFARTVFRGGVGNAFGKNLRWNMEKRIGETGGGLHDRNKLLDESSSWFSNRERARTEILHEYFIPVANLERFLAKARVIFPRHPEMDLLNITVRNVKPDTDTFLRYARTEVFGLVMLLNHRRDGESDQEMARLTRELIDAALDCGGTYYLPYRPHATLRQFTAAYPNAREFAKLKRKYDPRDVFTNRFWETYGTPLLER